MRLLAIVLAALSGILNKPDRATVFPKSPHPASLICYINADGETTQSRFTLHVLQGLVNRTQPRIYIRDASYEGNENPALAAQLKDWWHEILASEGLKFETITSSTALTRFASSYEGALLYDEACWSDPERAHALNVFTTLCGIKRLLPVTSDRNEVLKLAVREDARGKWINRLQTLDWFGTAQDKFSTHVLIHRHPWSDYATDYAVAHSAICFWMDKSTFALDAGKESYARVISRTSANTGILGVWQSWWPASPPGSGLEGLDELAVVKFFSDHAHFLVPVVSPGNLSFHSGFPAPVLKQSPTPMLKLDPAKVYVTYLLSDGDNISGFAQIRPLLWNQPGRGQIPIGWNFSPAMIDLCPKVLEHFYKTATPQDFFVTACSGLGYVMADYGSSTPHPARLFDAYLDATGIYMDACDSREVWNWWMNTPAIERYFNRLPHLASMFLEAEPRTDAYDNSFSWFDTPDGRRRPAFHNFGSAAVGLQSAQEITTWVQKVITRIPPARPAFAVLGFNGFQTGPTRLTEYTRRLPKDYEVVRPDIFVELYKQAHAETYR
ncbi:MAG: GxGYxYP domain-containing protein [Candidatus Sumerlaeaceae bacterium]